MNIIKRKFSDLKDGTPFISSDGIRKMVRRKLGSNSAHNNDQNYFIRVQPDDEVYEIVLSDEEADKFKTQY